MATRSDRSRLFCYLSDEPDGSVPERHGPAHPRTRAVPHDLGVVLETDPQILEFSAQAEKERWVEAFDRLVTKSVGRNAVEEFHRWIAETYTHVPADRPNWEGYEMFFFEWSVYMRDGNDIARCFEEPQAVYEAYGGFVVSRRIEERIRESRSRLVSPWDQRILALGHYSLLEDLEDEEWFDPFAAVRATCDRYAFQLFWEHLLLHLSPPEQQRLWEALGRYYDGRTRMQARTRSAESANAGHFLNV